MKAKSKVFKIISCLLVISILSQSCNIYHSSNLSVEEAIETNGKVRLRTNSGEHYIFKRIGKDEEGVYGVAQKKSKASRQLVNDIRQEESADDKVKIKLTENSIEEIKAQNKTLSVLVPLIIVAAGVTIFALTYEVNASPFGNSGSF